MKVIKIFTGVLIFLLTVLVIVPLLLPSSYCIERSIDIHRPADGVFYQLVDLTQRSKWDPWLAKEPTAFFEVRGSMQGVGAVWKWKGETIGKGSFEIIEIEENKFIKNRLIFEEPHQSEAIVTWSIKSDSLLTHVKWKIQGDLAYPVERFTGLFMNHLIGPDLEQGLENLKNL